MQVLFVTTSKVICILLTQDEVEVEKESNKFHAKESDQSHENKEDPTGKDDIKNRMNKPQYPIGFHL